MPSNPSNPASAVCLPNLPWLPSGPSKLSASCCNTRTTRWGASKLPASYQQATSKLLASYQQATSKLPTVCYLSSLPPPRAHPHLCLYFTCASCISLNTIAQSLNTKVKMMTSQKMSLFGFFDFKNGGLCHITINFDSLFRRLLASTTETNYTRSALGRSGPNHIKHFYHP